jgi:competence protein ComGC
MIKMIIIAVLVCLIVPRIVEAVKTLPKTKVDQ